MIEKNSHLPKVDLMDFCLSDILTSRKVGLECHEKIPDRVRCYLRDIELVFYANNVLTFGLIPSQLDFVRRAILPFSYNVTLFQNIAPEYPYLRYLLPLKVNLG